ncbi:MAG TPA: phage integrase SAM-like domain-containing protein [Bacteroidia bacterium]
MKLAENIKAKRELEIQNGVYGFKSEFKRSTNFIDYFKEQTEKRLQSKGNYGNWDSALKHLIKFAGTQVTFKEIDKDFCERFKEHLIKTKTKGEGGKILSSAAVASYFTKFRACLNKAIEEDIILKSPALSIKTPNTVESIRKFLTLDELKAVAKTEC